MGREAWVPCAVAGVRLVVGVGLDRARVARNRSKPGAKVPLSSPVLQLRPRCAFVVVCSCSSSFLNHYYLIIIYFFFLLLFLLVFFNVNPDPDSLWKRSQTRIMPTRPPRPVTKYWSSRSKRKLRERGNIYIHILLNKATWRHFKLIMRGLLNRTHITNPNEILICSYGSATIRLTIVIHQILIW